MVSWLVGWHVADDIDFETIENGYAGNGMSGIFRQFNRYLLNNMANVMDEWAMMKELSFKAIIRFGNNDYFSACISKW